MLLPESFEHFINDVIQWVTKEALQEAEATLPKFLVVREGVGWGGSIMREGLEGGGDTARVVGVGARTTQGGPR